MDNTHNVIIMKPEDNVAISLAEIKSGTVLELLVRNEKKTIEIKQDIKVGHKFAIFVIKQGAAIIKYGDVIGAATRNIELGEHVHVHNLEGKRGRGDKIG